MSERFYYPFERWALPSDRYGRWRPSPSAEWETPGDDAWPSHLRPYEAALLWMDETVEPLGLDLSRPVFPGWFLSIHALDHELFLFRHTRFSPVYGGPSRMRELRSYHEGTIERVRLPSGETVRRVQGNITLPDAVILEQMTPRLLQLIDDSWMRLSSKQQRWLIDCFERGVAPGDCPRLDERRRRGARR